MNTRNNDRLETVGKAGRLITPAALLALVTLVFGAGQTLDSLNNRAEVNCENTAALAASLHYEHAHSKGQLHRFAPIFPAPQKCR